uniref:Sarcosine oxidasee (formaldehyde-forming) n=1 Tax=Steinernema glaseri TaxID=37863 RepID=A0A1I7Z936_9BILA
MAEPLHDIIIIGAGIMGSCTAYHAAKQGLKPLVLEQFVNGHRKGSSHGKSRIIRFAHANEAYVPIMKEAYELWEDLEDLCGEELINKSGLLWLSDAMTTKRNSRILNDYDIEHAVLKGREIQVAYPQIRYNHEWYGLIDSDGGVIYADKCMKATQDEAVKHGAEFRHCEKVKEVKSEPDRVVVITDKGTYYAKNVAVTAGGWLNKILPDFDDIIETQAEQVAVIYWKVKDNFSLYEPSSNCPVIVIEENGDLMYMLPPVDHYRQIKLSLHVSEPIDPDKPLSDLPPWIIQRVQEHINEHFPDIDASKPSTTEICMYTMTEDGHCALGRYPSDPRITIAGGFSGAGFKLAIVVGRMLTDLAKGAEETEVIPELFRFERHRTENLDPY